MTIVLDAYALLVYLGGEAGCDAVRDLLADAAARGARLLMTSVNLSEVLYIVQRKHGPGKVADCLTALDLLPVDVVDVDAGLAREAARFKATRKMSFADCFAAALARIRRGKVVTGDREFKAVESEVSILWI